MPIITQSIVQQTILPRPQNSHKGTFGRVLLIGGNHQFGGAIIMATTATVNSGAGLVTVATDPLNVTSLHNRLPEAMVIDWHDQQALRAIIPTMNTIVIGPGLGTDAESEIILQLTLDLVTDSQQVIIDGSAITLLSQHRAHVYAGQITYTPHQMEWQRLSGIAIANQTPQSNQAARAKLQATVVLKSAHTAVYTAKTVWQNPGGNPGMAVGGTGDTLAGMIGGFVAQFEPHTSAIISAVYLHSYIADQLAKKQYIVLPHQISEQLPSTMFKFAHATMD